MKCDLAQQSITDYLENRVDAPLRVVLEHHFSECLSCRKELAGANELFELFQGLPRLEPPSDFRAQVLSRVSGTPRRHMWWGQWSMPTASPARYAMAGAASVMVAGLLFTSTPFRDAGITMGLGGPDLTPSALLSVPQAKGQPELLFSGPSYPAHLLQGTTKVEFKLTPRTPIRQGKVVITPVTEGLSCENSGVWNGQGEVIWQGSLAAGDSTSMTLSFKADRPGVHQALLHVEGENQNFRRLILIPALESASTGDRVQGDWNTSEAMAVLAQHFGAIMVTDLKRQKRSLTELDAAHPGPALAQLAAKRGLQWKVSKGVYNLYVDHHNTP